MISKKRLLAGTVLGAAFFVAGEGHAASAKGPSETEQLRRQVQALQQQLNELKLSVGSKVTEVAKTTEELKAAQKSDVKVTIPNGRPTISTADGNFSASLTARLHFDTAGYFVDNKFGAKPNLNSGVNARRAYLGVTGKLFGDWEYALNLDGGGSGSADGSTVLQEARLTYAGIKGWKFDIGYLDPNNNLDEATGSNDLSFIERASSSAIIESVAAGQSRAAIGFRTNGDQYFASAYVTGRTAGTPTSTFQTQGGQQSAVIGRFVVLPYKDADTVVHLGVNGSYVMSLAGGTSVGARRTITFSDRPELRVDNNSFVTSANNNVTGGSLNIGNPYTYGFELAGAWKGLAAQAQYARWGYDTKGITVPGVAGAISPSAKFDGYFAQVTYILTGESKPYNIGAGGFGSPKPARPFSLANGTWGAWEIGARYSHVNMNDSSGGFVVNGGRQNIWTLGVNWYVNNNVRFMLNYLNVDVDKKAIATNAQIGARYDAVALRTQFSF